MRVGYVLADIAWQFRRKTWVLRYLAITTALARAMSQNAERLYSHNLKILRRL
jgi:hypothetical protein